MEIFLVLVVTALAGALIWQTHRVEHYRRLATVDELTDIFNRRKIERLLREAVRRSFSTEYPVSLIILDIDHFKQFNDTYGYNTGDAVLRGVAAVSRQTLELGDLIGRWGGEEFVVILPGVGEADASRIAERLRLQVAAHPHSHNLRVTVSLGVACRLTSDANELFEAANRALRQAKVTRNCVAVG